MNTCLNCGKVTGLHSSILQGCMCQYSMQKPKIGCVNHDCDQCKAQRTWVGLTNNELQPIADEYRILFGGWVEDFARAIEAKFKEKNT